MIVRWQDGQYYAVEHGVKVAEKAKPLGDPPSHRETIRRIKALVSDGLHLNGVRLRFGRMGDGAYNPYLDVTASPHSSAGIGLSQSRMRNGDIVILIGQDRSVMPGHVISKDRRTSIELPWNEEAGKRFFVLDEGGGGILTLSLDSEGGDRLRVVPQVALASWLSSECPLTSPKYSLENDGATIRCPDGRMLESDDGRRFAEEDLSALTRSGLVGLLGKYRLRRVKQCQG